MHDVSKFMSDKPSDIGKRCYIFEKLGKCPYGTSCRFASSHLTKEFVNLVNEEVYDPDRAGETCNLISKQLQEKLRKRHLQFQRSEQYLAKLEAGKRPTGEQQVVSVPVEGGGVAEVVEQHVEAAEISTEGAVRIEGVAEVARLSVTMGAVGEVPVASGAVTDEGGIKLRPCEKKKVGALFCKLIVCQHPFVWCMYGGIKCGESNQLLSAITISIYAGGFYQQAVSCPSDHSE
jgi:tRNA-dihydrouridine synthase 3